MTRISTQNLAVRDIVGKEDELFQGEIRHDKPALKGLNIRPVVSARVGPDRGYSEFRATGCWNSPESANARRPSTAPGLNMAPKSGDHPRVTAG